MMSLGMWLLDKLSLLEAGDGTEWLRGDSRLSSELAGEGCWELDSLDFLFLIKNISKNIRDFCQNLLV